MYDSIPYSPSRLDSTLYIYDILREFRNKSIKVLDVGSGKLYFYQILNDLNFRGEYLGIDVSPKFITSKNKLLNSKIIKDDFLNIKINKKYDLVASLWVLEHIEEDKLALLKMSKVVGDNGFMLIAVPSIWSWPFEFGQHGYRYYTKGDFYEFCLKHRIKIVKSYDGGGCLGLLFMLLYSWPRYLILVAGLPVYILLNLTGLKISWKKYSHSLISNSWYYYHRFPIGIKFHNFIVNIIVKLDNIFKVLPASYVYLLKA